LDFAEVAGVDVSGGRQLSVRDVTFSPDALERLGERLADHTEIIPVRAVAVSSRWCQLPTPFNPATPGPPSSYRATLVGSQDAGGSRAWTRCRMSRRMTAPARLSSSV